MAVMEGKPLLEGRSASRAEAAGRQETPEARAQEAAAAAVGLTCDSTEETEGTEEPMAAVAAAEETAEGNMPEETEGTEEPMAAVAAAEKETPKT